MRACGTASHRRWGQTAWCLAGLVALSLVGVTPVIGQTSGGSTGTVKFQPSMRSISVDPTSFLFDQACSDPSGKLKANGTDTCASPPITVKNGPVDSQIRVSATDFEPSDRGAHWVLACQASGPDQVQLHVGRIRA